MAKEIKYGAEARTALEAGVNKLADTVRVWQHQWRNRNYRQQWKQHHRRNYRYWKRNCRW